MMQNAGPANAQIRSPDSQHIVCSAGLFGQTNAVVMAMTAGAPYEITPNRQRVALSSDRCWNSSNRCCNKTACNEAHAMPSSPSS